MVGVAGKSHACHDCRRRRVKCDFGKPACQRCAKANIKCGGYEKNLVFVNRTPTNANLTAVSVLSELKLENSRSEPLATGAVEPDLEVLVRDLFNSSKSGIKFRRQAVELIKRLYLPTNSSAGGDYDSKHSTYSWIYRVHDLAGASQAFDTALLALCVALLYITGSGNATLGEGIQLYNTSIQHLCADLQKPDTKVAEETLATIVVLSTCELFLGATDTGWRAHASGISELLRLRHSKMMSASSMWHHLVCRLRTICLLDALTKRRSTFLSALEWRQIQTVVLSEDWFELFLDIIANVPILLEEADRLAANPQQEALLPWGKDVIRSLASALVKLYKWHEDLRESHNEPPYTSVPSTVLNPADPSPSDKIFPFALDFKNLNISILMTFGWSVMLQSLDTIDQLHTLLQNNLPNPPSMEDILDVGDSTVVTSSAHQQALPEKIAAHKYELPRHALRDPIGDAQWPSIAFVRSEANRLARYICQSMEYSHNLDRGMVACQAVCYPIWVTRQHFRQHGLERELAWADQMRNMTGPTFRSGLTIMKFSDNPDAAEHRTPPQDRDVQRPARVNGP